jgi:hypothetical protein
MRVTAYADRCGIGQVDSNLWSLAFLRRRNETSETLKQRPDTSTWARRDDRRNDPYRAGDLTVNRRGQVPLLKRK